MTPRIHQIVAGYLTGDAISNSARVLRNIIRDWGHESEIYCERNRTAHLVRADARDLDSLADSCRPEDVAILHLSIGCRANQLFPALRCRKVILYHNITPAHYFQRLNPVLADNLEEGRRQSAALANVAEVNLADSRFNADELLEMGYRQAEVLPLMVDLDGQHREVDQAYLERLNDGLTNILFVGRVVPNKRHDELLRVFHDFQHTVEPRSRLVIAGSYRGTEAYHTLLLGIARELELQHVVFTRALTQPQLNACFRSAAAFLCMSEHEGFCVPLLEAMHHQLPVVAVAAAAVPETLDGAGILFEQRDHALIAESLGRVVQDQTLRQAVLAKQQARLTRYRQRNLDQELRQALASVL